MIPSNEKLDQIHTDLDALFAEESSLDEIIPMEEIVQQQQIEEEVKQNTASSLTSDTFGVVGEILRIVVTVHLLPVVCAGG